MTGAEPRPRGPGLGARLAVAVAVLAVLLAAVLLGFVGPATAERFRQRSDALVAQSTASMRALATAQAGEADEVLVDLIAHTTDARRRAFQDLPLELYADPEQLRAAVRAEDERRSARLRANAGILAGETRRHAEARIEEALAALRAEQQALVEQTAADLRTTHLLLCAALVAVAMLVLGIGLYRVVVRPVGLLRNATRRVAGGDLDAVVPLRSGDELGALAADFSAMVQELRRSRRELDELNAGLEQQVAHKTRELARAEKMAWIGTLAGGIAHEFNNLLGGVRGCAAELRADETDPGRRETLDVILRAADRAAAITGRLLQFARRDERRDEPVDLGAVCADVVRLLEPEARRRGVALERELAPDLRVRGDADALHQVLVNLVTNALQATPRGGRVAVHSRAAGGQAEVEVADTGTGIEAGDLDRVFEPFFTRRAGDRDPAQRGSGLGLAVSYGIVEAHGGAIAVRSEVGEGSAFTVRLPALREPVGG